MCISHRYNLLYRTSSYLDTGKKVEDIISRSAQLITSLFLVPRPSLSPTDLVQPLKQLKIRRNIRNCSLYSCRAGIKKALWWISTKIYLNRGDEFLKSASHLSEVMRHPQWARSRLPNETAFNAAWSTNKGFFEFMQDDVNKERLRRLGHAFRPTEQFSSVSSIVNCKCCNNSKFLSKQTDIRLTIGFPWDTLSKDAIVVDVGGGSGRAMRILVEHFEHLKCIVQDLPRVCERSREVSFISITVLRELWLHWIR